MVFKIFRALEGRGRGRERDRVGKIDDVRDRGLVEKAFDVKYAPVVSKEKKRYATLFFFLRLATVAGLR